MKIRRLLLLLAVLSTMVLTSCEKTCRCYRYDGDVDEFTKEELQQRDKSCTDMESSYMGNRYSLCENVIF